MKICARHSKTSLKWIPCYIDETYEFCKFHEVQKSFLVTWPNVRGHFEVPWPHPIMLNLKHLHWMWRLCREGEIIGQLTTLASSSSVLKQLCCHQAIMPFGEWREEHTLIEPDLHYVHVFVWVCSLTYSPLSCGVISYFLLPWFWLKRTECREGRREAMGESRKKEERVGCAWRGLFVTVNRLRVVHIIWPLMPAPPLL